ncbi:MAG: hypothetical protein PWR10_1535 [Halanaerobiales bacterium]|nr:hypothetical protein [Halanaerobiales bacterium]
MGMESIYKLGVIVSAVDKLTGPVKKMVGSVQNLENRMNKAQNMIDFGQRMAISGAMVQGAADKMVGTMENIMAPALDLQAAMRPLETVTTSTMGSIQKSLEKTKQAALDWSKTHANSADEYIRTTYMMASAGLNDVQAIAATETALRVAKATMADSADTANLVAMMYNNMGDKTADVNKEMSRLGDILTKTQQLFQLKNLGQLSEGLKYAIPSALQFGTSVEELNIVLGQLNNSGLQGSMAGTAFAASMRKITTASQKLGFEIARTADGGISYIGTLKNIRKQFGPFEKMSDKTKIAFQKAFGEEGIRAISLLTDKIEVMDNALVKVKNSTGAAAEAQRIMEAQGHEQRQILINNINALKIALSDTLLPALNMGMLKLRGFFNALEGFVKAHPGLTKTVMLIMGIMTATLAIVAPIMTVISALIMMTGYTIKGFGQIHKGFIKMRGWIKDGKLAAGITKIRTSMTNMFSAIRTGATRAITGLKNVTLNIINMSKKAAVTAATSIKNLAISVAQFGKKAAMQAVAGLKSMALGLANMARRAITASATALPSLIASVWSFTTALLANPITWIVVGVIALTAGIYALYKNWDKVSGFLSGVWNTAIQKVIAGFNWLKNILANVSNKVLAVIAVFMPFIGIPALIIKNWDKILPAIKGALNSALNWIKGLPNTFKNAGIGLWNAFVDGLKSVISKPVEIVKDGLQKVRNLLPFSDAKEGPLSSLTKSGRALVDTFGNGIQRQMPGLAPIMERGLNRITGTMTGFSLPTLKGQAEYGLSNLPDPNINNLSAKAAYNLSMPAIPSLPELVGKAKYLLEKIPVPSLKDINAKAIYDLMMPSIPSLPSLKGQAEYAVQKKPNLQAAIAGAGIGNIALPIGQQTANEKSVSDSSERPLVIEGDVHIHVDKIDEPMDFVNALKKFAKELGG